MIRPVAVPTTLADAAVSDYEADEDHQDCPEQDCDNVEMNPWHPQLQL